MSFYVTDLRRYGVWREGDFSRSAPVPNRILCFEGVFNPQDAFCSVPVRVFASEGKIWA